MKRWIFYKPFFWVLNALAISCLLTPPLGATPNRSSEERYLKALLAEDDHAPQLALKEYGLALQNDASSAFLAESGSAAALEGGDLKQAEAWAREAIQLSSNSAEGYQLLGRVLWAKGDLLGAEEAFKKSLAIDPISLDAVYAYAGLVSLHSLDQAKDILKRYLSENPDDSSSTYFQIADIDLKENDIPQAISNLKKSIAADPDVDSVASRYALARIYEQEHSTAAALSQYNQIVDFEPRNTKLLDHIAEIHSMDGPWAFARDFFNRALAVDHQDPEANYWMSVHAEGKKDFAAAIRYLKADAALSSDPYLNLQLSYDYTRENDTKDAVAVLESARDLWPKDGTIFFSLALGLEDLKKDKAAAAVLKAGLKANPKDKDMLYELGAVLERLGDMAGSEKAFKALLAQTPDDADALNFLGYSLADHGSKLKEAESLVKKAVSLAPRNGAYRDSLGWVYYKEGRLPEALKEASAALARLPEDGDVWEHISDIEAALKRPGRAWVSIKMSELLSPGNADARKKMEPMNKGLSKDERGRYFLDYFSLIQDDISGLSLSCQFNLRVMGHETSFPALCSFKSPAYFSLDVMGPLFSSLFSMSVSSGVFSMEPIKINGLSSKSMRHVAKESLFLIDDYLSGRPFAGPSATYLSGFGGRRVRSGDWTVKISKNGLQAEVFESRAYPDVSLSALNFRDTQGRLVPSSLEVRGKGFVFDLSFPTGPVQFNATVPEKFNP